MQAGWKNLLSPNVVWAVSGRATRKIRRVAGRNRAREHVPQKSLRQRKIFGGHSLAEEEVLAEAVLFADANRAARLAHPPQARAEGPLRGIQMALLFGREGHWVRPRRLEEQQSRERFPLELILQLELGLHSLAEALGSVVGSARAEYQRRASVDLAAEDIRTRVALPYRRGRVGRNGTLAGRLP